MMAYLSSIARSGVVSFVAITSLAAAPSLAAPLGPILDPPSAENSKPLPVAMGEGRDHGPGYRVLATRQVAATGTVADIGMAAAGTGMAMAIGTVAGAADIGAAAGATAGVVGVPVLRLASG